jgi:hypothetical protein
MLPLLAAILLAGQLLHPGILSPHDRLELRADLAQVKQSDFALAKTGDLLQQEVQSAQASDRKPDAALQRKLEAYNVQLAVAIEKIDHPAEIVIAEVRAAHEYIWQAAEAPIPSSAQ